MTFEQYKSQRHPQIPWKKLKVGQMWVSYDRTPDELKFYARQLAPKVFSYLECMNGTVIKREE